jgi:hypothetical protein
MHDSLEDVIHNQAEGVEYNFDIISADRNHSVVRCTMANTDGSRRIVAIGESLPETLDNDIAQKYPTLIASQRAFDRAAIRFLDLPGKVLSNMEMSFIDDLMDTTVIEDVPAEPVKKTGGIVSSVVGNEDDGVDINTGFEIEDIVDDTTEDIIVDDSNATEEVVADNTVEDVTIDDEIVVTEDTSDDSLPFDIETDDTAEDVGNYMITMNGKYATAGKTINEIYKTDASWIEWIAANFVPRNPVAEKDVEQIKKFVASKKGA